MNRLSNLALVCTIACALTVARAEPVSVEAPELPQGASWTLSELSTAEALPVIGRDWEGRTFWDLRLPERFAPDAKRVRWEVLDPADAGLTALAEKVGANRALCATDDGTGAPIGCKLFHSSEVGPAGVLARWSDLPGEAVGEPRLAPGPDARIAVGDRFEARLVADGRSTSITSRAVAEGVALLPAGPREVVLLRETLETAGGPRLRYRFLTRSGLPAASFEGVMPATGDALVPDRGELLVDADLLVDDGLVIPYESLSGALAPGTTGFLQYSLEQPVALSTVDSGWTTIAAAISIDATGVGYQPDPGDPGSQQTLPEVWDFTGLQTSSMTYRTFNSTRNDLAGSACLQSCASRDLGPSPPDGTWQAYLKIDNYSPGGSYYTRDIFLLNDNDTGADPSIDVPFVSQDELNVDDWTQFCFQQSAGGANRFLQFFQFTGTSPASAVMGVGDTWTSGAWTSCNTANGARVTTASYCDPMGTGACWETCPSAPLGIIPRARGRLGAGAGFRATIVEDGWVHVAPGNYVPALLMRQDTDLEGGANFAGTCNIGTTPIRSFDYFWVQERYGLLALISSVTSETITATDWSSAGNQTDGVDVTWGPYPPYQTEAQACLAGTRVSWSLPADGSNLNGEPGIADYGYVVSWGALADPEDLADWATNPNHTPLPGAAGYLAAPAGAEPTSMVITGWAGASINATVVTALRYTDPDVADQTTYRSAAFYKVVEDPARLNATTFVVGNGVAPFVDKSGADLTLAWPAVAGAARYLLRVWNLDTRSEIACPAGLDCNPATPTATHAGGATGSGNFGYRAYAVDPCDAISAN